MRGECCKDINSHVPRKHLERIHRVPCLSLQSTRRSKCRMDSQTDHLRGAHVDPCTCKHSTTISRNWGLSNRNETQSGKDSCTSCLMHRTRSCAHISHKERVRKTTVAVKRARWKKSSGERQRWRGGKGHDGYTGMAYSRVGMRHQCRSFVQMDTERG